MITFPNTLKHWVSPFSLVNRSKPGHRKILALFLVDRDRRVISSANVAAQREDWLPEERKEEFKGKLMTLNEARDVRLELMAERILRSSERSRKHEVGRYNLCER